MVIHSYRHRLGPVPGYPQYADVEAKLAALQVITVPTERTFSWFSRNRRLAKDYENLADTLAAFVTLAAVQFAIRRLARG